MGLSRRLPRGRLAFLLKAIAAAYVLALATLPLAHHDLLCHLKSSTHCITCHVGTSADDSSAAPVVPPVTLADAGRAGECPLSFNSACLPASSSGRSPPSTTIRSL